MDFLNFVESIALDVGKSIFTSGWSTHALRKKLAEYIEHEGRYNEIVSKEEEFDFQGLSEYIQYNLIDTYKECIFGKLVSRKTAKNTVVNQAITYANAKTPQAQKRVKKIVSTSIEILRSFFKKTIKENDLFMMAELKDTIEMQADRILTHLDNAPAPIKEQLSSEHASNGVIPAATKVTLSQAESELDQELNRLGRDHKLYPYYGYGVNANNQFYSKPLSPNATELFPPTFYCSGEVSVGDQKVENPSSEIADYAFRHQLPITLEIGNAKKYLGPLEDPLQHEAIALIGQRYTFLPPPLPGPFPCSITVNGEAVFDYILLKTKLISDDRTIILSNAEQQGFPILITVSIHYSNHTFDLETSCINESPATQLINARFLHNLTHKSSFILKNLDTGKVMLESDDVLYRERIEPNTLAIDSRIVFLEKIVDIENYSGTSITIPKVLHKSDFIDVDYVATLIRGELWKGTWTEVRTKHEIDDAFIREIDNPSGNALCLSICVVTEVTVLGQKLAFPIKRVYESVHADDLDQIKNKLKSLDIGDTITLEFKPSQEAETGTYYDSLIIAK